MTTINDLIGFATTVTVDPIEYDVRGNLAVGWRTWTEHHCEGPGEPMAELASVEVCDGWRVVPTPSDAHAAIILAEIEATKWEMAQ